MKFHFDGAHGSRPWLLCLSSIRRPEAFLRRLSNVYFGNQQTIEGCDWIAYLDDDIVSVFPTIYDGGNF